MLELDMSLKFLEKNFRALNRESILFFLHEGFY